MERFPLLRKARVRLVVDLYDPFPLEVLILFGQETDGEAAGCQRDAIRAVTDQIRDGDLFLCASEKQRDYWLGWLTAANRVNPLTHQQDPTLRSLIDVVPFGVPAEPPHSATGPPSAASSTASARRTWWCCGVVASTTGSTPSP